MGQEARGLLFGVLGMASFSLTLPATRVAVGAFDPVLVTLARALGAALLAAGLLRYYRQPRPTFRQWRGLAIVALGVVIGFPLLSAWAMQRLPSSHGAIVLGLLPLATAGMAALRAGERPSSSFWLASLVGSGAVLAFAFLSGAGALQWADLALVMAVLSAAMGYAEGGRLSGELGAWQVICWALVLTAPFVVAPLAVGVSWVGFTGPPVAWLALGYLVVITQLLGFIAWYQGMALGGIARIGQLQLIQPFITMIASGLLLGEAVGWITWLAGAVVMATVALGRRAAVHRPKTERARPL